jgi:hypothetical protein
MTMARNVPLGMAFWASFRSPDMFAPARMPVAAGKKMANTEKNVSFVNCGPQFSLNSDPKG